jgi:hypothetical protein
MAVSCTWAILSSSAVAAAEPTLAGSRSRWDDRPVGLPWRSVEGALAPATQRLSSVDDDLFLAGFLLVGAGLLAGGAGFTILGICSQEDEDCSDALLGVGWALAAPGIPPVVIGLGFILLSDRSTASLPPSYRDPWYRRAALEIRPIAGGTTLAARLAF